jgi:UMF1 family MFS transporter
MPDNSALNPGVTKREVWAWASFDFANSGYTTVVLTAVFNAYFVGVVAAKAPWATFAWTLALSVSFALVILSAPLLGAFVDLRAAKKRVLIGSTVACVVTTAMLALVGPGDLWLAVVLIVLSNFFYMTTQDICAAFLPELARPEQLGKVSGWGWAWGYFGGLVTLGACLAYITYAQREGQSAAQFVPMTNLITAAIFALAAWPAFVFLRERAVPQPQSGGGAWVAASFARLLATLRQAARFRDLRNFLLCVVCYQAGVQTVIALAAIYAQEAMGFSMQQTLLLVLVVNVTAALGAFGFGYLQDRLGHWLAMLLVLLAWLAMIVLAWFATTPGLFWLAANIAGLAMGSSQSAARAMIGYLSPRGRQGEFFGLWGLAVNLAAVVGPLTYGAITWITGNDHRLAILGTGCFFVAGLIVLMFVDVPRGRAAAQLDY